MTQNSYSKVRGRRKPLHADVQGRPGTKDHNHPVTLEAFDREGMGIAAKE